MTDWSASWAQGAGAMWSTVEDLGRWAATGSGNALLPRSLVAERLRNGPIPEMGAYGMGLQIVGPWIGHAGATFGWETLAIHNRESGATFVAAVNASGTTPQNALITILQRTFPRDGGRRVGHG